MRDADVFVDLSVYQAFGRTPSRPRRAAVSALVPRIGGAAEAVIDGENGIVIDTGDEAAVIGAVAALAEDPERLARLRQAALQTARTYSVVGAALSEYVLFAAQHRLGTGRFG